MTWTGRSVSLVMSTALLIALVGVGAGLLSGILVWALLLLREGDRATFSLRSLRADEAHAQGLELPLDADALLLEASGPLLFTSVPKIDGLLSDRPPWPTDLVLDLRRVSHVDSSALSALTHLIDCLEVRGGRFALVCRPRSALLAQLQRCGLTARALGETCCFSLALALERIAARYPRPSEAPLEGKKRPLGALRLLRMPTDHAR